MFPVCFSTLSSACLLFESTMCYFDAYIFTKKITLKQTVFELRCALHFHRPNMKYFTRFPNCRHRYLTIWQCWPITRLLRYQRHFNEDMIISKTCYKWGHKLDRFTFCFLYLYIHKRSLTVPLNKDLIKRIFYIIFKSVIFASEGHYTFTCMT